MSEQQRTRLYAWLCEQTDESLAEYLMTCLAPAPLSDLVTKDHLSTEVSRLVAELTVKFATKEEMNAGFAKIEAQRAEDRAEAAAQRAEDRSEAAAQRSDDRSTARQRHFWLTGTVISVGLAVGAPVWLSAFGIIG